MITSAPALSYELRPYTWPNRSRAAWPPVAASLTAGSALSGWPAVRRSFPGRVCVDPAVYTAQTGVVARGGVRRDVACRSARIRASVVSVCWTCLLYTSDAADEEDS